MKTIRHFWIIALIMVSPFVAAAQVVDCSWFPAPCPHSEEINQAMNSTDRMTNNRVTEQEMNMENNLRNAFTDILHKVTRTNHWTMYEIMESDYDRPNTSVDYYKWEHTPYEKRPPHVYSITFIIVVNKDSLQAWQDWYKNDLVQHSNQVVADIKSAAQNSSSSMKRLDAERIGKTEEFTGASLVLINFTVNERRADFGVSYNDKTLTPQKTLSVPGAFFAGLAHNPNPPDKQDYLVNEQDYVYYHPRNVATVLFGKWQSKHNAYSQMVPVFVANSANTDLTSAKPVKCDSVQSLSMQVEGRPDYIQKILSTIDSDALKQLTIQ